MGSGDSGNRPEAGMMSNVAAERTGIAALIRGPKDFWTGVIYLLFGGIAFWIARDYGLGTASRMGPGYFPTVLSALLVLIGVISVVRSFIVPGEPLGKFALKAGVLISSRQSCSASWSIARVSSSRWSRSYSSARRRAKSFSSNGRQYWDWLS